MKILKICQIKFEIETKFQKTVLKVHDRSRFIVYHWRSVIPEEQIHQLIEKAKEELLRHYFALQNVMA